MTHETNARQRTQACRGSLGAGRAASLLSGHPLVRGLRGKGRASGEELT